MTLSDHYACFDDSLWGWTTIASPAASAGFARLTGFNSGFTNDWRGFAGHYGVNLAGNITSKFFGDFLMPSVFHEDQRYQALREPGIGWKDRAGHVIAHLLHTRPDGQGKSTHLLNWSAVTSFVISAGLSNLYEPKSQRTAGASAERLGFNVGVFVASDAYTEFKPELHCLITLKFDPCRTPKPVDVPSSSTINFDQLAPMQSTLANEYLKAKQMDWGKLNFSEQLEFAGATQALAEWCGTDKNCRLLQTLKPQPGLDLVKRLNTIAGQNSGAPSNDQFYIGVTWTVGSEEAFASAEEWSEHWALLHPGYKGYEQNKDGDPFLGLVVLFNNEEPTSGQLHIGFRTLFGHYESGNANIAENYELYCAWYEPIAALNYPCPSPYGTDATLQLSKAYAASPPGPASAQAPAEFAFQSPANASGLDGGIAAFLKAWYLDRDVSKLSEFIANDNAFQFEPVQREIRAETRYCKAPHDCWKEVFEKAFTGAGPRLQSLNQAIRFTSPSPAPAWLSKGRFSLLLGGESSSLYKTYDSRLPPPGTFFPKPVPKESLFFAATNQPRFNARALFLDHLRRDYDGRLQILVYSVIGPGLVREDAILYWILEGQQWKLAAFQGTD
jgi:hypothetical protein